MIDIFQLPASSRQRFGLRAKNARAKNPLVNNGIQHNAETACVLAYACWKRSVLIMRFCLSKYTSHFYCDTFAKVCPPLGRNEYIHHQFASRYASHLYHNTFAEVSGSGVFKTPPLNFATGRNLLLRKVYVRKVAERKFPEFFEFSSRISPRIFPDIFEEFSCFISWRRSPENHHLKSPLFFQCKFPGKFEEKIHKSFLESGQSEKLFLKTFKPFKGPPICHPFKIAFLIRR